MAEAGFIKFPGIEGASQKPKRADWIELTSFQLDVKTKPGEQPKTGNLAKIRKDVDNATPKLAEALKNNSPFKSVLIELEKPAADGRKEPVHYATITLEDVRVVSIQRTSPFSGDSGPGSGDMDYEIIGLSYARHRMDYKDVDGSKDSWDESAPKKSVQSQPVGRSDMGFLQAPGIPGDVKSPPHHAVVRANTTAVTEHSTINLRPPKFFELALPVLKGANGGRIHPPADATLRLVSNRGYDRGIPVAQGMITDDDYCSFRFHDISEKALDELFTATLEENGEIETIFKDRRVATYIQAARQNGKYETAFSPPPVAPAAASPRNELLAPVGEDGVA